MDMCVYYMDMCVYYMYIHMDAQGPKRIPTRTIRRQCFACGRGNVLGVQMRVPVSKCKAICVYECVYVHVHVWMWMWMRIWMCM